MLKYRYQLNDDEWVRCAFYTENENGNMIFKKTFYLALVDSIEEDTKGKRIITPEDDIKKMNDTIQSVKATGKRASVKCQCTDKPRKSYASYNAYLREE